MHVTNKMNYICTQLKWKEKKYDAKNKLLFVCVCGGGNKRVSMCACAKVQKSVEDQGSERVPSVAFFI